MEERDGWQRRRDGVKEEMGGGRTPVMISQMDPW